MACGQSRSEWSVSPFAARGGHARLRAASSDFRRRGSKMNKLLCGLTLAGLFALGGAVKPAYADDIVTVGGTEYDVTNTPYETFASAETVLEEQPWWGDPTLANELASAVYLGLGDPN